MIILISANKGSCRIRSTSPNPSISGMCASVKTRGGANPASAARRSSSSAAAAPPTTVVVIFQRLSVSCSISRFVALSSTTSTATPASCETSKGSPGSVEATRPTCAVKQNVAPLPASLSTVIFPPIISTSCAQIVNPNPVPPYFRVVEESACENASKMFRNLHFFIALSTYEQAIQIARPRNTGCTPQGRELDW